MIGRAWWIPWLWLAPTLALLGVFLVYPSFDTIRRSFFDARSEKFVGFDNYQFIIDNPTPLGADIHAGLLNTLLWLMLFTAVCVGLGLVMAVLTARVRYEAVAKAAIFVPMAISFVAVAVIWRFMYEIDTDVGAVNAVFAELGKDPVAWINNTEPPQKPFLDIPPNDAPSPFQVNNFALIAVGVWNWTGFTLVILSAGLKSISKDLMEAARVDGAGEWQIFRRITLPLMLPTIIVVTTTLVITTLKTFDLVWVLTGGRDKTDVVATLFFKEAFIFRDFGVGAAVAVVLMAFVVPVMLIGIRRFLVQEEIR